MESKQKDHALDSDSDAEPEDFENIAAKSDGHEPRTAHFNKMMYLRSFGIRFELPTAHIIDAAVFARNSDYIIQVIKYILPSERRTNLRIYPEVPLLKELNAKGNVLVRLQKKGKGSSLYALPAEEDGYVILENCQDPMTCFSYDGTMFAYFVWEEKVISHMKK